MNLATITYDQIKHLIVEERFEEQNCFCTFKIEGELIEGQSYLRKDMKDGGERIKSMVRMNALAKFRTVVLQSIRKVVGGGMIGNTATMVGSEVVRQNTSGQSYSAKDRQDAVVKAFQNAGKVNFFWDETAKNWRVSRRLSDFERRIKEDPIERAYDKKILGRMLVEMAKADGSISKEEKDFLQGFLTPEMGTFAELMRAPALSKVECEEVSSTKVKENILMIVSAIALSDHDFQDSERQRIVEYGKLLALDEAAAPNMLKAAQDYTIVMAIKGGVEFSREEIYEFADKIGMDRDEAERSRVRMEKRQD